MGPLVCPHSHAVGVESLLSIDRRLPKEALNMSTSTSTPRDFHEEANEFEVGVFWMRSVLRLVSYGEKTSHLFAATISQIFLAFVLDHWN